MLSENLEFHCLISIHAGVKYVAKVISLFPDDFTCIYAVYVPDEGTVIVPL